MPLTPPPARRSFAASVVAMTALTALAASLAVGAASAGDEPRTPSGGFAGASGEAGSAMTRQVRLNVGPTLPGIDVSHWQDEIDWAKVARAGKRFVFMKATDGHDFLDPRFFQNRAGARANGIVVGAYHFARPDPSKGDAAEEARWFVSQADPRPGNLLPVLDLETSKGLEQRQVTWWARRWVAEVRRLTGVTPLVYTSPYGWMRRTGDSRALARDGARLWIAHWGVQSPLLPAGEWNGNGWRVWQHTSHGRVAGIRGRVDLDVVKGRSLGPITIRRLSLQVVGDAGHVISFPAGLGCHASCAKSTNPNVTITLSARPDPKAYFTGWGGDCRGDDPECTITMRGNRSVRARFVTDITAPTAVAHAAAGFRGPVVVRFDEPVRRIGPGNVFLRRANGERVRASRTCRSAGGGVVGCDGLFRSVALTPAHPLVPGRDYEAVVNPPGAPPVVDRVGNAATPSVDGFEGPRSVEEGHVPVGLWPPRAWRVERSARASAGSFALAREAGAAATIRFDGTGIDWVTVTGPNRGRARVTIDGARVGIVDLYAPTRTFGVVERFGGLADRVHSMRIEVLGRRSAASHGRWVAIDRFVVLGA
jgi:GH25 family lysozyme M1 (1,4-beta-N-acetylmuramidase)